MSMGNIVSEIFIRLFDYPLKKKPFAIYKPNTVINSDKSTATENETYYETLQDKFGKKLIEKRKNIYENRANSHLCRTFPDWNETTISYLHSLFLMFLNEDNKLLSCKSFECILECLGEDSDKETRKSNFRTADKDSDGYIDYFEFLYIVYNFNSSNSGIRLRTLSMKVAKKVMMVNSLCMEKQLEYGLF